VTINVFVINLAPSFDIEDNSNSFSIN